MTTKKFDMINIKNIMYGINQHEANEIARFVKKMFIFSATGGANVRFFFSFFPPAVMRRAINKISLVKVFPLFFFLEVVQLFNGPRDIRRIFKFKVGQMKLLCCRSFANFLFSTPFFMGDNLLNLFNHFVRLIINKKLYIFSPNSVLISLNAHL